MRKPSNMHSHLAFFSIRDCARAAIIASLLSLFISSSANAFPFDPVQEVIRWGQPDHLIIDRGGPVDYVGDVNGDGLDDVVVASGQGGIRVIFGPTNGNNGTLNAQQINGNSGFNILHDEVNISHVAGVGDINADGYDDVAVGSLAGTHVFFGQNGGFSRNINASDLTGINGFSFVSPATSISGGGDINNDGIADLIVGNGDASPNGMPGAGVTYVIYGRASGFTRFVQPSRLNGVTGFTIVGVNGEDRSGKFVGDAGDFNHDGYDDILIGAPNHTQDGKAEVGEAYLVYGGPAASLPVTISLAEIDGSNGFVFKGNNIQDSAGSAVSRIGDLNHDGIEDIAIGAPGKGPFGSPSSYPGETYVLFGGNFYGSRVLTREALDGTNGMVVRGIRGGVVPIEEDQAIWGDLMGTTLDAAGDFNNDGIDDLMIGASHTIINPRRKGVGQTYIVYGSTSAFSARFNVSDLDGANGFRMDGKGTVDYFGVYARRAGDFNDDQIDDVIIGASGQGESYIIYGRDSGQRTPAAPRPDLRSDVLSSGFLPVEYQPGTDATPLAFNELRDPTGPQPLPPGTPSTLGDPDTPGDIRPYAGVPVPPVRLGNNPNPQPDSDPPVTPPITDDPLDESDPPTSNSGATVKIGAVGALWSCLLLLVAFYRRWEVASAKQRTSAKNGMLLNTKILSQL